tara:strand:- start:33 stop:836 length:804 start_codon:yes stop_codon:yes gene_type:complete
MMVSLLVTTEVLADENNDAQDLDKMMQEGSISSSTEDLPEMTTESQTEDTEEQELYIFDHKDQMLLRNERTLQIAIGPAFSPEGLYQYSTISYLVTPDQSLNLVFAIQPNMNKSFINNQNSWLNTEGSQDIMVTYQKFFNSPYFMRAGLGQRKMRGRIVNNLYRQSSSDPKVPKTNGVSLGEITISGFELSAGMQWVPIKEKNMFFGFEFLTLFFPLSSEKSVEITEDQSSSLFSKDSGEKEEYKKFNNFEKETGIKVMNIYLGLIF